MIEIDSGLLEDAIDDFDNLVDDLDNATDRDHHQSIYRDIERNVDQAIVSPILQRARELGRPHVGDRVNTIQSVTGNWRGDEYIAGLRSTNEVVLSHEYGSGQYGTTGPYRITPNGSHPLAFVVDGRPIFVEFVVHPGVRGKRFMQRAIREHADQVTQDALDDVQQTLGDAFDN